jgi:hypothetical protein
MSYILGLAVGSLSGIFLYGLWLETDIETHWDNGPDTRPYDWDMEDCDLWR